MANKKAKKDNKGAIIGVCAAVVVLVVVIVAVVLATGGGGSGISDSYFKSDDTKYVLNIETGEVTSEDENAQYIPVKTHYVYTYSGDDITGLKVYYEYADANSAKESLDFIKNEGGGAFAEVVIDGKYVVATATEEQYTGMTASDAKQYIEFMESLQNAAANGTLDDGGSVEETQESETVETTENKEQ